MEPAVRSSHLPVLPLLALAVVAFLNIMNRCAVGFCYTYGWPWVAYRGFSDSQVNFGLGSSFHYPDPWVWPAVVANAVVGLAIVSTAVAVHIVWVRRRVV